MVMHHPAIAKPAAVGVKPNLADYDATRRSFKWEDVEKELDWLPGGGLSFLKKSAVLMLGALRNWTLWRFACGLAGGVIFPLALMISSSRSFTSPLFSRRARMALLMLSLSIN